MEDRKRIYADNAATTPVSREVLDAMLPYLTEKTGNPSALHAPGREAARAVNNARKRIAAALHCEKEEIFFTSCGSESDNWAIKGTAFAYLAKNGHPGHLITTSIEHHAVLHSMQFLETLGFSVTYVNPMPDGIVRTEDIMAAVREDTCLIAVMHANNEIGTVQPIREIAAAAHERGIPVFCDAVQSIGQIPVDLSDLGVDMLAMSGHKIHTPKGIGLLYVKDGFRPVSLIDGGGQERGRRAGTENVPYIVGLAAAVEDAVRRREIDRVYAMRERLFDGLCALPGVVVNGIRDKEHRLPGNVNVSFTGLDAESMVLLLDTAGISASAGSACNSKNTSPSHVLSAIGRDADAAKASVRFTLSRDNTMEEIETILAKTKEITDTLRAVKEKSIYNIRKETESNA